MDFLKNIISQIKISTSTYISIIIICPIILLLNNKIHMIDNKYFIYFYLMIILSLIILLSNIIQFLTKKCKQTRKNFLFIKKTKNLSNEEKNILYKFLIVDSPNISIKLDADNQNVLNLLKLNLIHFDNTLGHLKFIMYYEDYYLLKNNRHKINL